MIDGVTLAIERIRRNVDKFVSEVVCVHVYFIRRTPKEDDAGDGVPLLTTANDYCEDRRVEDYDVG